jgi:hypothetical protein
VLRGRNAGNEQVRGHRGADSTEKDDGSVKTKSQLWNVWAVVGGKPIAVQNAKPLPREKALSEATQLEKGATKATRVLVTRAA